MSRDQLAEAEWKADCLQSRMDALARSRADAVGEEYTAIRKRAERRGLEATVTGDGVKVVVPKPDAPGRKYVMKTVRTMAELEALMGTRGDAEDPCWEGYEQRGTKEKGGSTVPNCVKADAYTEEQEDEIKRKFPKGAKVRENRQGAEVSTVIRVNVPMVLTSSGEYHYSKLVRA